MRFSLGDVGLLGLDGAIQVETIFNMHWIGRTMNAAVNWKYETKKKKKCVEQ